MTTIPRVFEEERERPMSSEILSVISTGGAGVAVTVVTIMFLRFLREERKELMSDRREERHEFLQGLSELSARLEMLAESIGQSLDNDKHCLKQQVERPSFTDIDNSNQ